MPRVLWIVFAAGFTVACSGCGSGDNAQPIDVSKFDDFTFTRTIEIDKCFAAGDLLSVTMAYPTERAINHTGIDDPGHGRGIAPLLR